MTKTEQHKLLCDFFKFFRDNGEAFIGISIEEFVTRFLDNNKQPYETPS